MFAHTVELETPMLRTCALPHHTYSLALTLTSRIHLLLTHPLVKLELSKFELELQA